jgi:hypothetical protein
VHSTENTNRRTSSQRNACGSNSVVCLRVRVRGNELDVWPRTCSAGEQSCTMLPYGTPASVHHGSYGHFYQSCSYSLWQLTLLSFLFPHKYVMPSSGAMPLGVLSTVVISICLCVCMLGVWIARRASHALLKLTKCRPEHVCTVHRVCCLVGEAAVCDRQSIMGDTRLIWVAFSGFFGGRSFLLMGLGAVS